MLRRPRRNRKSAALRAMVQEHFLHKSQLILPLFLLDRPGRQAIESMPGVLRMGLEELKAHMQVCMEAGVTNFALFPVVPEGLKDATATYSYVQDNFYLQAISQLKKEFPTCSLMSDVAMDPYSSDGHDGLVQDGEILNDASIEILEKMAIAQAQAGVDIIGPSDMMDGRIGAMRHALETAGHRNISILSYSAKYASGYYGPFRDAVGASGALQGDKKTYQMDPGNSDEALRLVERDLQEGADMVMVKPGIAYLDICHRVKSTFGTPTFAYQVSGEYAMIQAAAQNGWIDGEKVMLESLMAFKRAGCDGVLSYFAPQAARILNG